MRDDIQEAVFKSWNIVTNENFGDLADYEGYQAEFLKLFGFGMDGIDYDAETDTATAPASIV